MSVSLYARDLKQLNGIQPSLTLLSYDILKSWGIPVLHSSCSSVSYRKTGKSHVSLPQSFKKRKTISCHSHSLLKISSVTNQHQPHWIFWLLSPEKFLWAVLSVSESRKYFLLNLKSVTLRLFSPPLAENTHRMAFPVLSLKSSKLLLA